MINEYINEYYRIQGLTAISINELPKYMLARKLNEIIILSDSRVVRGMAKFLHIKRDRKKGKAEKALQFFAMDDAIQLLNQKGVPVYFYNRVGEIKTYNYDNAEKKRMYKDLTFPKMYECIDKYEDDFKEILGDLYSKEYVRKIGKISQVIKINGTYVHEDCSNEYVNVKNGKRVTTYQPKKYQRTLHIYGRCGVFGYAVEDAHTIPSFLQKELIKHDIKDIKVINHGLWGGEDEYIDHNFLQDAMGYKEGDIVLFYRKHYPMKLLDHFIHHGVRYLDITERWHNDKVNDKRITFYNQPGHMNAYGYALVARLICDDLIISNFGKNEVVKKRSIINVNTLKYYLKTHVDTDFMLDVQKYVDEILQEYPACDEEVNNGAIVMNCNPFTNGHRYLVENAAKQVDRLYIFVVEENKSFFDFNDRITMVKRGTEDLSNVVVVPSGKFIISAYTFPEYFMKDYVKEKSFDVSMDVNTFCQYIAPPLHIKYRFAGEEPFDPVTKKYNESMALIMPQYGMVFCEIKRLELDEQHVINATAVRELLKRKDVEEIRRYVPQSTLDILIKKYLH